MDCARKPASERRGSQRCPDRRIVSPGRSPGLRPVALVACVYRHVDRWKFLIGTTPFGRGSASSISGEQKVVETKKAGQREPTAKIQCVPNNRWPSRDQKEAVAA